MTDFEGLLDVAAVEKWIGDRLPGEREALEVERITTGASNEMFILSRAGERWVLRRPPKHVANPTASNMQREFRVLRALDGTAVPHPRPLLACDEPDVIGAPFYLMDFVDGFTPKDPLPPPYDADPAARHGLGTALVDGIADLALVDWKAAGLEGFGKPEGFLERQVGRWLSQLEKYKTREIPGLGFVAGWLEESRPEMGEPAIMHGDYQFINVMFAHGAPARLAAIVDWEQSTIGDPLLDLGWLVAGWSDPGEEDLRFASTYARARDGLPTRADLIERYARHTSRAVEGLAYYVVLALFKLACVLEGSYWRFSTGKSTNPMHERMGEIVLRLGRQAEETARTRAI